MAGTPIKRQRHQATQEFMKDPEAMDKLCEFILGGQGLFSYCVENGLKRDTVRSWVFNDPERVKRYKEARSIAADAYVSLAEEALNKCERDAEGELTGPGVNLAKHKADHYRWMATKLDPSTYGEKVQVDSNTTVTVDIKGLIEKRLEKVINREDLCLEDKVRVPLVVEGESVVINGN